MKLIRSLIAAAIAALSFNAMASDVSADGTWFEFDFAEAGTPIYDLVSLDTSFSFTVSQTSLLRVVDLGFAGDRFEIYSNGQLLGQTSGAVASFADQQFDADLAWADNAFSKGAWTLAAGTYTITGTAFVSPLDGGYAAMSVVAVPEPGEWAMMLAGLGVLGAIARRRSIRQA